MCNTCAHLHVWISINSFSIRVCCFWNLFMKIHECWDEMLLRATATIDTKWLNGSCRSTGLWYEKVSFSSNTNLFLLIKSNRFGYKPEECFPEISKDGCVRSAEETLGNVSEGAKDIRRLSKLQKTSSACSNTNNGQQQKRRMTADDHRYSTSRDADDISNWSSYDAGLKKESTSEVGHSHPGIKLISLAYAFQSHYYLLFFFFFP